MRTKLLLLFCFVSILANAQQSALQFFRPNNKLGLNVFETNKTDTVIFDGVKVRIGGDFAMNMSINNTKETPGQVDSLELNLTALVSRR